MAHGRIKGNRIDDCLYEKNMTRAELIEIIGADYSHIYKIIRNQIQPTLPVAYKISKALGYPIEIVFIFE